MQARLTPSTASVHEALLLEGETRPWAVVEVKLDGGLLRVPRYPYRAVDPPTSSWPRRQRQDFLQVVADGGGRFRARLYLPEDTALGLHILSVQDFGTPRKTALMELEVVGPNGERQPGCPAPGPVPPTSRETPRPLYAMGLRNERDEATAAGLPGDAALGFAPLREAAAMEQAVVGPHPELPPVCLEPGPVPTASEPSLPLTAMALRNERDQAAAAAAASPTYRLAPSSWPTLYHDAHLSKLLDLDHDYANDDVDGPNIHLTNGLSTHTVALKWKVPTGLCISSPSQGTDGSLYYAVAGTNRLYRINPTTGCIVKSVQIDCNTLVNQPMVLQENGVDRIYLVIRGGVLKFDTSLKLLARSPCLEWRNPNPLDPLTNLDEYKQVLCSVLIGAVCTFSNLTSCIIMVAQGSFEQQPVAGTVLYALDPNDLSVVSQVDIVSDIWNDFDDFDASYPSFIRTINTASIGPVFSGGTIVANEEMVYVLLVNNYLLAYRLGKGSDGRAQFLGRSWPSVNEEYLKGREAPPSPLLEAGYYFNKQSGTSPTVSPDGKRVYMCSGISAEQTDEQGNAVPNYPRKKPRLYAFDTSNGSPSWATVPDRNYVFASDASNVPVPPPNDEALDGKVISSPSCVFDAYRQKTMIYVAVKDGGVYGFSDDGGFLLLAWGTHRDYTYYGMNSAVAGDFYYAPFYLGGDRSQCFAGGVNIAAPFCNSAEDCQQIGARPEWQYLLDTDDICVRTVTQDSNGKTQVFFGTLTTLYCFEEHANTVPLRVRQRRASAQEVRTWKDTA